MKDIIALVLLIITFLGYIFPATKDIFSKTFLLPIGTIPAIVVIMWWLAVRGRKPQQPTAPIVPTPAPMMTSASLIKPKSLSKIRTVEFPEEKITFSLEYPTDKEDIADWIKASSPRCLDHPVFMVQKRIRSPQSLGPVRWVCQGCSYSVSLEKASQLEVLAKTRLLKELGK